MTSVDYRAAQYLRMSTEHQQYSLENQAAVLAEFAQTHGMQVVRSYVDAGVSGRTFKARPALQRLIGDVLARTADFKSILVLDVSRWGRFDDPDEAGHYEFLCREAGLKLYYCAEPFGQDGRDPLAPLVKQLKRVLAAEYVAAQARMVKQAQTIGAAAGRFQGGAAPFGLRRALLNADGTQVEVLASGGRKWLAEQRVTLVHGPRAERDAVQTAFHLYAVEGRSSGEIAAHFEKAGPPRPAGGRWGRHAVRTLLRNELYTGTYVFNRRGRDRRDTPNPREEWVTAPMATALVSDELFAAARLRLQRDPSRSEDEMLDGLRSLLAQAGRLDPGLIDTCPTTLNAKAYGRRFGSLAAAYARIGHAPARRPRFTDAMLLVGLQQLAGRRGAISGPLIDAEPSIPRAETYRRRFGSIQRARELAQSTLVPAAEGRDLRRGGGWTPQRGRDVRLTRNSDGSPLTDRQLLAILKRVHRRHGGISFAILRADRRSPSPKHYYARFGSLVRAYELAGIAAPPPRRSKPSGMARGGARSLVDQ